MRALLTGTSNAIITGGISRGLARSLTVRSFTNAPDGASGTVPIGDHLRTIDFRQHDVCVIDCCESDDVFLYLGKTTLERGVSIVMALVDAASRVGCLPVIAILPTLERSGLTRPLEEALLEKLGPLDFAAYEEAEAEVVAEEEWGQEMSRASRLINCDLLSIPPGARIIARQARQGEIAGIPCDQARTRGEIGAAGAPDPSQRTTKAAQFQHERELALVSRPLPPTATFEDGRAEIACTAGPAAPEGNPPVRLEMRGLILRDREHPKPLAVRRYRTGPLALDARVQARREGILARNLRAEIVKNLARTGARAPGLSTRKEAR